MQISLNKSKVFDVQTISFAEILLVILFILLIFNFSSLEKIDGNQKEILKLKNKNLEISFAENKENTGA